MTLLPADHSERMSRARLSLEGLSLGDSFGERFMVRQSWTTALQSRQLPPPPWKYTDDTEMAMAICEVLETRGDIDQDQLAARFGERYALNPYRGYGPGAHELLSNFTRGNPWRKAASELFDGQGSHGNGAAMRVAPLGAYFAGEGYGAVVEQARRSAEVTHTHPEGIAGAIAVALAAAWAARATNPNNDNTVMGLFEAVLDQTPSSDTRDGIAKAAKLPIDAWQFYAAEKLGNGGRVTSADTVPFCIWIAARHIDDFTEALWSTVHVGGDIDTNCAIVAGIVSLAVGTDGLPSGWMKYREQLS